MITKDGRIVGLEFYRTESDRKTGKVTIDEDQTLRVKCDFIISAFGSTLKSRAIIDACKPVEINDWGKIIVDEQMSTKIEGIFAGGDIVGSETLVEAANDGKTASWYMHKYIQEKLHNYKVGDTPTLPQFFTPIDTIDISVEMCGLKFLNPFGLLLE